MDWAAPRRVLEVLLIDATSFHLWEGTEAELASGVSG